MKMKPVLTTAQNWKIIVEAGNIKPVPEKAQESIPGLSSGQALCLDDIV